MDLKDLQKCYSFKQMFLDGDSMIITRNHDFKQDKRFNVVRLVCRRCGFVKWYK